MEELIRNARVDPRPDAYKDFFDKEWFEAISGKAHQTKLREVVFDLARAWLGASHVHAIPWVFATSIDGLLRQKLEVYEPLSITQLRGLREKVVAKLTVQGVSVRPTMAKALNACFKELGVEADQSLDIARAEVCSSIDAWAEFLNRNEFKTILWSGERMCYGSLYYHYEWFLTECMRIKLGNQSYRIGRHDDFKEEFESEFGRDLQQSCWSAQSIFVARAARHALVHNGGRVTGKLEKQLPKDMHNEGELQIMAEHTTSLYALLKEKTMMLVTELVELKEFQY